MARESSITTVNAVSLLGTQKKGFHSVSEENLNKCVNLPQTALKGKILKTEGWVEEVFILLVL